MKTAYTETNIKIHNIASAYHMCKNTHTSLLVKGAELCFFGCWLIDFLDKTLLINISLFW